MKRMISTLAALAIVAGIATAKNLKTVVFAPSPQMTCENCENTIKKNIRFEKGVKNIKTDLESNTVTVTYDADKTNVGNLQKGFEKIDYTATVKAEKAVAPKAKKASGNK